MDNKECLMPDFNGISLAVAVPVYGARQLWYTSFSAEINRAENEEESDVSVWVACDCSVAFI